jgi:pentatricopeptide repeat protein
MLDPETPVSRLWDTYMIFQHVFRESPRSDRISIMNAFFDRNRPDMALHVFNHMRRHASPIIQPDTETYITALIGCGRTSDSEALHTINNVLKLDISVVETTRLHNARMIAFFQCGDAEKAQGVWDDIVRSEEGPSRHSLICIFRVCEQSDFGEVRARSVWGLIRGMDVPLDSEVVAAYVGALARNGCQEEAVGIIESGIVEVDELVLGKLYNVAVNTVRQEEAEKWIMERYKGMWEKLGKKGFEMRWDGTREVGVDVRMEP